MSKFHSIVFFLWENIKNEVTFVLEFFDFTPQLGVGIFESCYFWCFRESCAALLGFILRGILILFFDLCSSTCELHSIEELFFEILKNKMAAIFQIFIDHRKIITFVNDKKIVTGPSDINLTWQNYRCWPAEQCFFWGQSAMTPRVTYKGHSAKIIALAPPTFIFWTTHSMFHTMLHNMIENKVVFTNMKKG